jgi:hypothetical protein
MPRDRTHLPLPTWSEPLPRRVQGGGAPRAPRADRGAHGSTLVEQARSLATDLAQRRENARGVNPKLVFRLRLTSEFGSLSEEQIERYGLGVLAREPGNVVVVFPSTATLEELRRRLNEYAGLGADGYAYGELDAIESIERLTPDDRIGPRLRERPVGADELAPLDIELWHSGYREECRSWVAQLRDRVTGAGGRLTDAYIGEALCVVRVRASSQTFDELLTEDLDFIKEIERPPQPTFEMLDVIRVGADELPEVGADLPDDAVGVLVIDSGVVAHPLLGAVLGDAQVFPDRLRERIVGGAGDGDVAGGHGTAVCGIAVYGDLGECIASHSFVPGARLFSARVTDDANRYDEDELLEHQLEAAVTYFLDQYPQIHVINISLGNSDSVYREGAKQFRFAAAIDELAYRFRDREVVFVVSAGNYIPETITDEELLRSYPDYLLQDAGARLLDPATSALALTVGSLSYGAGRRTNGETEDRVDRLVAGEPGHPSPFSRTGFGIGEAIKPEVVDIGGDLRFESGQIRQRVPQWAGIPTTSNEFAAGRLFRTVAGTSFAAPRVAHLACRLFQEMPGISSNLVRALIADSARVPTSRPASLADKHEADEAILRLYGYGQPDFARARWSSDHEALLVADDVTEVDQFQLYELPSLPPEFLTAEGVGELSVSLAFDPPTRHTRADSYLGITMEVGLFRNLQPDRVAELLRAELAEERAQRGGTRRQSVSQLGNTVRVDLKPRVSRRKPGTLQRGTYRLGGANWRYNGESLVLAVTCRRKWAPVSITSQRFAVVVSISHTNASVPVYEHARQQVELRQRQRARVRG